MKRTFAQSSNIIFRQIALAIIAVSGALLFLLFEVYQKIYLYAGALLHQIETACGCTQITQLIAMHPFVSGSLLAASAVISAFVFYAAYRLLKLAVQTRKFSSRYLAGTKAKQSSKLKRAIIDLNLNLKRIVEIREAKPVVFCFGLWQPQTCISQGLIKILCLDELKAVLLHEHQHMIAREPLKLFIIKYFQGIFFFVPGIKTYVNKYLTFSELAADERATGSFSDKSKLASALLKIAEAEERQVVRQGLALSFFSAVISERINKLSDNSYMPKFKLWSRGFLAGLCLVVLMVSATFILLADSTKAFAMHHNGSCGPNDSVSAGAALICRQNNYQQICDKNSSNHLDLGGCDMH